MAIEQSVISSMSSTIFSAINYIKSLKERLLARKQTILERETTISAQTTVIALRDDTIVERNAQIDVYIALVDGLRQQVTDLGGSLETTEALYQEQLALKEAALQERALAEEARQESERQRQLILEAQAQALDDEMHEDRSDALRLQELSDAVQKLAEEASRDYHTETGDIS